MGYYKKTTRILLSIMVAGLLSISFSQEADTVKAQKDVDNVIKEVSVKEAYNLVKSNKENDNFVILDVRTEEEYNNGHIKNAININLYSDNFKSEIMKLDPEKEYLVYCRSGGRSHSAAVKMKKWEFENLYNFSDGIMKWRQKEYPLVIE